METESILHHRQLSTGYRNLQPQATQALQHSQPQHLAAHHTLASQSGLEVLDLDDNDDVFHQDIHHLQGAPRQGFHSPNPFERAQGHRPIHTQANGSPHTPQQQNAGQFGILTPGHIPQHDSITRLQHDEDIFGGPSEGSDQRSKGHMSSKVVFDPPNLDEWRQKLFDVDEMITLSEDE